MFVRVLLGRICQTGTHRVRLYGECGTPDDVALCGFDAEVRGLGWQIRLENRPHTLSERPEGRPDIASRIHPRSS